MSYYHAMLSARASICNCVKSDPYQILRKTILHRNGQNGTKAFSTQTPIIALKSLDSNSKTCSQLLRTRNLYAQLFVNCRTFSQTEKSSKIDTATETEEFKKPLRTHDLIFGELKKDFGRDSKAKHFKTERELQTHSLTLKDIEKLYPQPKNVLHAVYSVVSADLHLKNPYTVNFESKGKQQEQIWNCEYKVAWPESMTFSATEKNKQLASKVAALKCLHWLHENQKMKNGKPIIYKEEEIKRITHQPDVISVDSATLQDIDNLITEYENEVKNIIANSGDPMLERTPEINTETQWRFPVIARPTENSNWRSDKLLSDLLKRECRPSTVLPIHEFKEEILKALDSNQVLLIKGETGCGKTTQVPQFIMDHLTKKGKGSECNMIVTQPRRISAITLAERVASERNERVGDVVGYQVRLEQTLPRTPGAILFCTTGMLRLKLQKNPGLTGCSHVILDEAHERTIDTDMLIVLLKRAMILNPELKVVVMSATINADLFQDYFQCPAINVPGKIYPVKMHFLDDLENLGISGSSRYFKVEASDGTLQLDPELVTNLIHWISGNKPPGAILCFLPGWGDILKVKMLLENDYQGRNLMITPIHSKLSYLDQRKIFSKPLDNTRKVILATDIAETGITVPDVVYVVDSVIRKEMSWDFDKCISSIKNTWVSKANVNQRKGRAGRVQSGESYHLIARKSFEALAEFPLPEVVRSSLDKTVLDCKTHSNEKAEQFLGDMPEPPSAVAVQQAVLELMKLGALDTAENLTALGKRIAHITVHPKLGKAMVLSPIFNCVNPVLAIASAFSIDTEIFSDTLKDKSGIRKVKERFQPVSDHLSIAWIFAQWEAMNNNNNYEAVQFCNDNRIIPERIKILQKVRDKNVTQLKECRMLNDEELCVDLENELNSYAELDELIRGVLVASTDNILKHKKFVTKTNRMNKNELMMIAENGSRGMIGPESVNYKRNTWPSPYVTYYRKTHSEERRAMLIRETSMVSPLTVLLFSSGNILSSQLGNSPKGNIQLRICGKSNVILECDPECAKSILKFREMMWEVAKYFIKNQGFLVFDVNSRSGKVDALRRKMLGVLASMLSEAASPIDAASSNHEDVD